MVNRIRQIQESMQMTQQDFAKALGISPSSLSSIYTGRTAPSNGKLVQSVHQHFPQINIRWLMFGEGSMLEEATPNEAATGQATLGEQTGSSQTTASSEQTAAGNGQTAPTPTDAAELEKIMEQSVRKILDKPQRRILKIHVFYDDGTFESFVSEQD